MEQGGFREYLHPKKEMIKRLEELDDQIAQNPSPGLEQNKNAIWQEYEQILFQEELL